ncbi:hypothetical protein QFC24_005851 [Naganishia onofrii]|uniref:Uncharacterized protein n=1 Tax=Naganishia onofrii TaxID=1851511 RepID=A0ACC2X5S3_9TREE|nr:hypothetical protein QFC24_005851 [Naganishia onofrii]
MGKAALSSTPPRPTLGRSVGASVNSESLIENAETLATWSPAQPSVLLASIAGGSMTGDEHDGDLPRSMNHDLLEHFDDVERDMLHGEWEDAEGGYRAGAVLDNVEVNQEDSDDEVVRIEEIYRKMRRVRLNLSMASIASGHS